MGERDTVEAWNQAMRDVAAASGVDYDRLLEAAASFHAQTGLRADTVFVRGQSFSLRHPKPAKWYSRIFDWWFKGTRKERET